MRFSVTVGIPVYNEERNIGKLLNYLNESAFDFDLNEILVVCSGCTDNSVSIVRSWMEKNKKIKLLVEKERIGKYSAINKILKHSSGDFIIFSNSDTLPRRNALNFLMEPFSNPKVCAVTGRPLPIQSCDTLVGYFQHLIWDFHHEVSLSFKKISGELFALRKPVVKKIPTKIINDDAYFTAAIPSHCSVVYQHKAEVLMIEYLGISNYIAKRRRIAEGFMQLSRMGLHVSVPMGLKAKAIVKRIKKEPEKTFAIMLAVVIEICCNVLASFDLKKGKIDYVWKKTNKI